MTPFRYLIMLHLTALIIVIFLRSQSFRAIVSQPGINMLQPGMHIPRSHNQKHVYLVQPLSGISADGLKKGEL